MEPKLLLKTNDLELGQPQTVNGFDFFTLFELGVINVMNVVVKTPHSIAAYACVAHISPLIQVHHNLYYVKGASAAQWYCAGLQVNRSSDPTPGA